MLIPIKWTPTPIGEGWDIEPDPVIWLDVSKMEAGFQRNKEQYVGENGSGAGQFSRYAKIGNHFTSGHPMFMPHISLREEDVIWFTDGRHRFAWIRDHGALAIPVTTSPQLIEPLSKSFGTSIRECTVQC